MSLWFAALVALAVSFAIGHAAGQRSIERPLPFGDTQRGHLARLDAASGPGRVVFLGASTFQGLDVAAITPRGLNLSLGGDTLAGLTRRVAGYGAPRRAEAIWIHAGLNDLLDACALPSARLEPLLDLLPATVPVFVLGVQGLAPTRVPGPCEGRINALVASLNALHAQVCAQRATCRYVPHPLGADASVSLSAWESDGIHPSPKGYEVLIRRMREAMAAVRPDLVAPAEGSAQ